MKDNQDVTLKMNTLAMSLTSGDNGMIMMMSRSTNNGHRMLSPPESSR